MSFLDEIKNPKKSKEPKARDRNIELSAKGEINLGTKSVKDKTKYTRKEKHRKSARGVDLFDNAIDSKVLGSLKTLANLDENDITFSDNGFNFTFERSLKCNYVRLVEKNNHIIVEFRNKKDDPINGKKDYLVYENVIKPQQFKDVFENVSGIYLSYI